MWWKVYFWALTIILVLGLLGLYSEVTKLNVIDGLVIADSILTVIGLFAFAFSKKILSVSFWKIYFWISMIVFVVGITFQLTPIGDVALPSYILPSYETGDESAIYTIFGYILIIPAIYAFYKLGYPKK